jgi:protein-tyrosine-phosphatase
VAAGGALKNVLLVCHANTCRSVMAHVLLEQMLDERRARERVVVRSGGIANHARDGMIPSLDARIVLREDGIHLAEDTMSSTDLRRHREIIAEAHLIPDHDRAAEGDARRLREAQGRDIFTLKEFVGESGDIHDPFEQGEDKYRYCRDEIKRCLAKGVDRLLARLED